MFLSAPARGSGVVDRPQRVKVESQLDPYGSGIATGLLQLLQRRIDPRLRAVEIVRAAGIRKLLEPCCCWKGSCRRPRPHRRSACYVVLATRNPRPDGAKSASTKISSQRSLFRPTCFRADCFRLDSCCEGPREWIFRLENQREGAHPPFRGLPASLFRVRRTDPSVAAARVATGRRDTLL